MTELPGVETGDTAVDEAIRTLHDLEGRALREHVAVFDAVHRSLSDRLAEGQT